MSHGGCHRDHDRTASILDVRFVASGTALPRINDAWIAGADLVRIEAEDIAKITGPIDVAGFVIAPASGDS
jgi:hypothetical protein